MEFNNLAEAPAYQERMLEYAQKLLGWRMNHEDRALDPRTPHCRWSRSPIWIGADDFSGEHSLHSRRSAAQRVPGVCLLFLPVQVCHSALDGCCWWATVKTHNLKRYIRWRLPAFSPSSEKSRTLCGLSHTPHTRGL